MIPGWAQGLTVVNRPLILRTLSPEGKLFWSPVTLDFSNVPDEAMVLFFDIGAPATLLLLLRESTLTLTFFFLHCHSP